MKRIVGFFLGVLPAMVCGAGVQPIRTITLSPWVDKPAGLGVQSNGYLFVTDYSAGRLAVFNPDGSWKEYWGRPGRESGDLAQPWGVTVDWNGNVYVADTGNNRVQVFGPQGTHLRSVGGQGLSPDSLRNPAGLLFLSGGSLLVADTGNGRLQIYSPAGTLTKSIPTRWGGAPNPLRAALSYFGNICVLDVSTNRLALFTSDGSPLGEARYPPALEIRRPRLPTALLADTTGDFWVADAGSLALERYDSGGRFQSRTALEGVVGMADLAAAPDGGLYVLDDQQKMIFKFASR
jgi:DNA-binding beta-propeller fold protein YncE